jgi:TPR repeat protein
LLGNYFFKTHHSLITYTDKGMVYFKRAAELGSAMANFSLAMKYALGKELSKDIQKADVHWERSILNPDAFLEYNYVVCHLWKVGDLKPESAVKWFKVALEKGNKESHVMLRDIYRLGKVTPKDTELSEYRLKQAIKYGFGRAFGKLAEMY